MTAVIEIENGLVSMVDRTVRFQVPMKDWLDQIEKRNPLFTPVLPVGTRGVYWDQTDLTNQKLLVLIEMQPQIINMDFSAQYGESTIHRLSIPWTRFFFYATTTDPTNTMAWRLNDYRVFWAKRQYNDPTERDMIRALLPNVYGDGRICFGSTAANMDQSLAQRLDQTVNEFYVSRFNRDLTIYRPNGARTWRTWERMTEKDPTGWMEWDDLDPVKGGHQFYSFDSLATEQRVGMTSRFSPMVAAEPIPEVPIGATFGRLQQWLNDMGDTPEANSQRDRLLQAMLRDRALNNERYMTPSTEEDDDLLFAAIESVEVPV